MSESELTPAILHLERKVSALTLALNVLREEAGLLPHAPSLAGDGGVQGPATSLDIKPDTFFGKRQHTAIREYLEMRYAHNLGPATPREIYDALLKGGFRYDAKEERTAVGLRSLLRRRTNVFVKVADTGAYGLVSRYGSIKPTKSPSQQADTESSGDSSGVETPEGSSEPDRAEGAMARSW